ncbi:MAG: hypothetical protein BWK79_12060 [Beggiatoa sp. IS2]|nr:MAG: hypothetical protein BWK79_12060 [Beggiatoa sp. IS2]
MKSLLTSLRLTILTILLVTVIYAPLLLIFAYVVTPDTARGSLLTDVHGHTVGSKLLAQKFTQDGYFWARPSATDYVAHAAGGSNLSPTNPQLAERVRTSLLNLGVTEPQYPLFGTAEVVPLDLVTASGSGLDPHISLIAARYQISRVAAARQVDPAGLSALVDEQAIAPLGTPMPLVNVLLLNLKLDSMLQP